MGKQTKTQQRQYRSKYQPHTGKKQIAKDLERAKRAKTLDQIEARLRRLKAEAART